MKILFIYHLYGDDRWLQYTKALEGLGHSVDIEILKRKSEPKQISHKRLTTSHDLVWVNSAEYVWSRAVPEDFIKAVKEHGKKLIGYCTLKATVPFNEWFEYYKIFDFCLIHSKQVTQKAQAFGLTNIHHMPYGFDPETYYPLDVKKDINVSFAGTAEFRRPTNKDRRTQIVNALKDFNIKVYGETFSGRVDPSIEVQAFSTNREMNLLYNRSKINLDIPCVTSDIQEINQMYHPKFRLFDVPGSGSFLLSGYTQEFDDAFQEDRHCVYYRELDDLCSKLEYYLTHEKERVEIERAGRQHALKYHQHKIHLKTAMDKIQESLG